MYWDKVKDIDFIVKTDAIPIFGLKSCVDLNLIHLVLTIELKDQITVMHA